MSRARLLDFPKKVKNFVSFLLQTRKNQNSPFEGVDRGSGVW